jgi:hypothetical protein
VNAEALLAQWESVEVDFDWGADVRAFDWVAAHGLLAAWLNLGLALAVGALGVL